MIPRTIGREELFEMAASPIGSSALMAEAVDQAIQRGAKRASPELREAAKRAAKVWLPEGRRTAASPESREYEETIKARQIDLEDAVEAAGGQRGGASRRGSLAA